MKKFKAKSLAQFTINGRIYSIRATAHAVLRMHQRQVSSETITSLIARLGDKKIVELQKSQSKYIIQDLKNNIELVISFEKNTIKVITTIKEKNIFNTRETATLAI